MAGAVPFYARGRAQIAHRSRTEPARITHGAMVPDVKGVNARGLFVSFYGSYMLKGKSPFYTGVCGAGGWRPGIGRSAGAWHIGRRIDLCGFHRRNARACVGTVF
ncbi:hypothetical protein BanimalisJ1_10220 [Bifidobacterium animalis]|nr:hypothetical protein BanimalisJ1_10220 [Bifidobacterium animalis]GDZ98930.1 hypothetical protein BanimalisJ2_09500 [Bifidobacterium animalis]GDZ99605.1 hypothetical protein BanimalisJ3_00640 [Bifidobacterium animalis]